MMKKTLISTLILGSFATTAHAQVTLYDYTEATSDFQDSFINGNLSLSNGREDDQTTYQGDLNIDYDQIFSSPDVNTRLQGDAIISVERGGSEGDESNNSYSGEVSYIRDKYFQPSSNAGFWFGSATLGVNSAFDNRDARSVFGIGYGRVKNVTPMVRAIRVIEALGERGFIINTPTVETYNKVANIIAVEDEYRSKYGSRDYQQNWVGEIIDILKGADSISQESGAAEVLRTFYVLDQERISTRRIGWVLRAGIGYAYQSFDSESDSGPTLEVGAEYHLPLGNSTQFSNELTAFTIIKDDDDSYTVRNAMSLTHEISDRVDWENSWTLDYTKDGQTEQDVTVNTLNTTFIYSINNALDYTLSVSTTNFSGDENIDNLNGTDTSVFMGFRYRLK